ncbi:single-stranded DNA-binding protein [Streptomyces sp. sk226]|uniref:single-stranded DNA-binding protein n=1 Tax=Streptomyces sp. sk226 TaxID=2034268 RepID=UPI000BF1D0CB|nr:single-stranded DNA-binding protein [Streptomyces sp. sk226]
MAGETVITVVGNLVDDPELRFTPGGAAVAKFRVASVPRTFNRETQQWEDAKDGLFLSCSVWRQAAENAAETLQKGMRVIVQGRLKQRSYEDREGVKRTVYELDVEEVGPSLKSATAKVTKAGSGSAGQGQGREEFQRARQEQGRASAEDPWASDTPGSGAPAGGWGGGSQGGGYSDEPPF